MLKLTDIVVHYGPVLALKEVSIVVQDGEIVTILGANGAGKSTTLRAISGLLKLTSGAMEFGEEDISRVTPERRVAKGIAHVPEGRRVFPGLSVMDNLLLGACVRSRSKHLREIEGDMDSLFTLFPDLKKFSQNLAWTLSGGQQQMLAIARGLMARPRLLLLDEPSLGLAPVLVEQVFASIKQINQNGTTILLVEQNAHMALDIAARGYVLETGKMVLHDTAANLLRDERMKQAYLGPGEYCHERFPGINLPFRPNNLGDRDMFQITQRLSQSPRLQSIAPEITRWSWRRECHLLKANPKIA
jgi:branched-chain amino acid transport system ATP-binding protein